MEPTVGSSATFSQTQSSNDDDATIPTSQPSLSSSSGLQQNNNVNSGGSYSTSGIQAGAATSTSTTTFLPLTRARMRENLDNQDVIDINNLKEEEGASAASKARFNPAQLTEEEYAVFFDLIDRAPILYKVYIHLRDKILDAWYSNVQHELNESDAGKLIDFEELRQLFGPSNIAELQLLITSMFWRLWYYLDRTGKINFGLFDPRPRSKEALNPCRNPAHRVPHIPANLHNPPFKPNKNIPSYPVSAGRVIVLGAGLSGLIAARQLKRFGLEVIVLEARNRVGGRVHTYRKNNFIADLGPSSLNGVVGNPLVVLGKQLELMVMELKQKIPIYENKVDKNGSSVCHQVDPLLEKAVEREYHKIMEGTRVMKNNYRIEDYRGNPFPVGMAVDWVMKLQEKNIKDDQVKHLDSIKNLYQQLIESANKKLEKARIIKKLHGELCSIKDSTDLGNHKDKKTIDSFNRRYLARDLDIALKEYKLLLEQEEEINNKISELTKSPPSDTYLSLSDRRLLDWHFAELEYALGCPINKLGIYYEDDEQIFDGSHWMLVHGFNTIVEALKVDLDIQLGTAARKITIDKKGCKVLTYQPDHPSSPYVEYTADAVLCTLPLGVMQDSILASQKAAADNSKTDPPRTGQKGYQPVIFSPPLPKWKTQSFNKLGCGNLNKIVLCFDKVFWNHELHLFGVVNHKAVSRGEFFLFWHHGRTPTLTGLISGEAADYIEKLSDLEILDRCLSVLRSIYGNSNVPQPKEYVVTKWRKDPWARGAWSYLQVGASGDDYENCAEPVVLEENESAYKEQKPTQWEPNETCENNKDLLMKRQKDVKDKTFPRLFFAGEHTTRHHFASAHGAVITGLREAARIANIYFGCPYQNPSNDEGIILV